MLTHHTQIKENTSFTSTNELYYITIFILLISCLAYTNTLNNDWVWDDVSSVLIHKHVQDPSKFFQLFKEDQHAFGRGQGNFYRPLVSVSFMIDFLNSYTPDSFSQSLSFINLSPLFFHFTNIILHSLVGVFVGILLLKLQTPIWVAFWVSTIYCIHPLHTEAVAYISGRADMMSGLFILLGILCGIKYTESRKTRKAVAWCLLSLICFIFGLLSKESTNIYPFLLILILFFVPYKTSKNPSSFDLISNTNLFIRKIFLVSLTWAITIIYFVLRLTILNFSHKSNILIKPWSTKIIEIGQAFAFYIKALLIPTNLHMEQTLENTPVWTAFLGYGLLLLFIAILFWAYKKRQTRIFLGVSWFLITWFPISGFFSLNAPQAEHWMYVPMIGFWWCGLEIIHYTLSSTINSQPINKVVKIGVEATIILIGTFYFSATILRNNDWKNNETIFKNTLTHNPNSTRVRFNLAVTYEEITKNYPGAIREYTELLKHYERLKITSSSQKGLAFLNEEEIEAQLSLGKTLFRLGKFTKAIEKLTPIGFLIQHKEYSAYGFESLWFLAQCYLAIGEIKTYQIITSKLVNIDPNITEEIYNLALGQPIPIHSHILP